ncbi:MAG: ATP-binding protein [Xenococcaceae cyanobacterium MO_167.B27]|nr:ATP-binding protein [Xenococcaceae cyanobacterium MO_167.B27]
MPQSDTHEYFFQYHQLIVDSYYKSLDKVLNWFESLREPFIPRQVWLECQTMLGEGFDNVLIHAHEKLPQETPIEIEVIILSQLIILKIWDWGSGFDMEQQKIKVSQGIDEYAENGRGIHIFAQTADHVSYINNEKKRNYLLIIKMYVPLAVIPT